MKLIKHYLIYIPVLLSVLALTGCASTKKSANTKKKIKDNEIVVYENNVIVDPVSNYIWEFFEDNPTTYYRFKLNNTNSLSRLPALDQMTALLEKISYQLESKRNHGNVAESRWFDNDCNFLTSSSVTTPEGEVLYEVVHWNPDDRSLQKRTVTGGDLVVILLLNEN
ncbi:MAG: hypothetical protein JXB49_09590 [Bacteroidales bacterium]|nr:hypothetical protein [Bacteroidales bacterium]